MRGVLLSLIFHAMVVGAGFVYLPRAARVLEEVNIVPVDLITLADTTNIRAATPDPVEEEPEPEEIPEEEEIAEPEAPAPEPEPEPAEPEPLPVEEDTAPEPEPDPEPEEEEPAPTPTPRPQERPQPVNDDPLDLSRFQGAVNSARDAEEGARRDAVGDGEQMTAELRDMLASHIRRCFRSWEDLPYPEERAIAVNLELNRDGTLRRPPEINAGQSRERNDRFRQTVRERALRAAAECQPYPLPASEYSRWRRVTAIFR